MKRKSMHLLFGALALACAGVAAWQAITLVDARALDARVDGVLAGRVPLDAANDANAAPAVRLARALMLAKANDHTQAASAYDALIATSPDLSDPIARTALFDAAGMSLRDGSMDGNALELRSLTLVADAKSRYRALLRATPGDWDARYNLERALRLSPELQDGPPPPKSLNGKTVRLRGAATLELP